MTAIEIDRMAGGASRGMLGNRVNFLGLGLCPMTQSAIYMPIGIGVSL